MLFESGERYFNTEEKISILHRELQEWEGTPYKHWCGVKGKGCDCIFFVSRVMETVGATNNYKIRIPRYNKDWHLHRGEQLLKEGIEKEYNVVLIGSKNENNFLLLKEEIKDGDLILYKFGRHAAHCGIYLNKEVWQTLAHSGVERRSWKDPDMMKRTTYVYKIVR